MRPYTFSCLCLQLLLLLLVLPLLSNAQGKNFKTGPKPTWLAPYTPDLNKEPHEKDISDGYFMLLYEEQQHAELNSSYYHSIRKIVSEAGIQSGSEISVDYDPSYQQLIFHEVIIRRDGKIINQLNPARFKFLQQEQDLSRFIYSGTFTAYLILEDIRTADQIEYAFSITGRNPIFENKFFNSFYFAPYQPIVNYYKNLIAAPQRKIQFKAFNGAQLPEQKTLNGLNLYEWNIKDIKKLEDSDTQTPSWFNKYPYVQASEYTSWKEVADWARQINKHVPPGEAIKAKVAALKKEAGSNQTIYLQNAMRFVQDNIRYMGIEMGENSHRPNNPEKVLTQRFGDCKDKSLLLCTLLQADNINANMAYVNTYDKGTVTNKLPTPYAFNHAIVYVTLNGKNYWIDPTVSYQRGELDNFHQPAYQMALVITDTTTSLTPAKPLSSGKTIIVERLEYPSRADYPATMEVTTTYTGKFADNSRSDFATSSMKDKEAAFVKYYKSIYGDVSVTDSIQVLDTANTNTIQVLEKYQIENAWTKDSITKGKLTCKVTAQALIGEIAFITDAKRKSPVLLKYPTDLDYTIEVVFPEGWGDLSDALHIKNDYYQFDFTSKVVDRTLYLHYKYKTFQDHVPVDFIPQYVKDVNAIDMQTGQKFFWMQEGTQTPKEGDKGTNWLVVAVALMFTGFFAYLAWKYSHRSVLPVKQPVSSQPIGGWLVLLAIGVTLTPFIQANQVLRMETFSNSLWEQVATRTDLGNTSILQLFLIGEVIINAFLVVYAILLVVLFYKRRDIFPFTLATFYIIQLIVVALDAKLTGYLFKVDPDPNSEILQYMIKLLVMMFVWIPYLLKSERATATFTIPHHSQLEEEHKQLY
jgi:transglutaminase-like putative cysteine protease